MDSIRTLLLARTHTVVLDPDRVASAGTRPTRDVDLEKFEDELAQLGYVMSLDLAMTLRRLPYETILELRSWIAATLAMTLGAHRPHVPLFRGFPATTPTDTSSLYLRRMLTWILTHPAQPCPWCGQSQDRRRARSVRPPGVPVVLGRRVVLRVPDLPPPRRDRGSVRPPQRRRSSR